MSPKILPFLLMCSCFHITIHAVAPLVDKSYLIKSVLNRLYLLSLRNESPESCGPLFSLTTRGYNQEPLPFMKWNMKTFELSGLRFDQSQPDSNLHSQNILTFEKPMGNPSCYPTWLKIDIEATEFKDTYLIKSLGSYGTKGKCLKVSDDGGSVTWDKCALYSNRLWKFEQTN